MGTFSPGVSLPGAHEYVRAPADMHPRLVRLTSPNITNTGLNSRELQASAQDGLSRRPWQSWGRTGGNENWGYRT